MLLHVLVGAVITDAVGKITTFTSLLTPHEEATSPAVEAAVAPQASVVTYLALTV
jgi:hypothetical protein